MPVSGEAAVKSTAAPWAIAGNRINHFDAIRLILAVLVVLTHCYDVTRTGAVEPLAQWTRSQLQFGSFAVNCFFTISGFLIAASWEQGRGLADFLRKRAFRIYPGFLAACVVCALVLAPLATGDPIAYLKQIDLPRFAMRAAMLRTMDVPETFPANPHHGINLSLWTIAYEFLCYLMVATFGLLGILRRRWVVAGLFAGAVVALALWPTNRPGALSDLVRLTTYFLGGMCFHLYRDRIPYSRGVLFAGLAVLAGTALLGKGLAIAQATIGTYVLFHLAFLPARPIAAARHGDLSYGVYLYGFPVQQWVVHVLGASTPPPVVFVASLVPVAVLALLSWKCVERPFLMRARSPRSA
ncbi:MAG: acyltransferase family protein [Armatimonadota bacterium]